VAQRAAENEKTGGDAGDHQSGKREARRAFAGSGHEGHDW
jgi:hypothetical protein